MPEESRRYLRFQAKKGAFAVFFPTDKDECVMLGQIVDISQGGFGICYVDIEREHSQSLQTSIYGIENAGFVNKLPCRIVYKMDISRNPIGVSVVGRCGVTFEGLSRDHGEQLKQFIKNIGIGAMEIHM